MLLNLCWVLEKIAEKNGSLFEQKVRIYSTHKDKEKQKALCEYGTLCIEVKKSARRRRDKRTWFNQIADKAESAAESYKVKDVHLYQHLDHCKLPQKKSLSLSFLFLLLLILGSDPVKTAQLLINLIR